ncbi:MULTISPECIES: hypothetical protein [unclassified Microbacterium]|uniref:hypothetical protein n=1 Tax=unclassified Microbacterium TaxID=2609290 RepID=UPI0034659EAD
MKTVGALLGDRDELLVAQREVVIYERHMLGVRASDLFHPVEDIGGSRHVGLPRGS